MSKKCILSEQMLARLLERESPWPPDAEDLEHAKNCPECAEALKKVESMEKTVLSDFDNVRNELPNMKFRFPGKPTEQTRKQGISGFFANLSFTGWATAGALSFIILISLVYTVYKPWEIPIKNEPPDATIANAIPKGHAKVIEGSFNLSTGGIAKSPETFELAGLTLTAIDRSVLHLDSGIEIAARNAIFNFNPAGIVLKSGKIKVSVPKKGLKFSAITPTAILGVRGTVFDVSHDESGVTNVEVTEGEVSVETVSGEQKIMIAGDKLAVTPEGKIIQDGEPAQTTQQTEPAQTTGTPAVSASGTSDADAGNVNPETDFLE